MGMFSPESVGEAKAQEAMINPVPWVKALLAIFGLSRL
jgi:hypothetical protein